jgi:hypothetical protein
MLRRKAAALLLIYTLLLPGLALAQQAAAPAARNANDPIERIKDEGLNRSQVMQTLSYLTDVIGPRLTNSPQMKRANEWTRDKMASWGLANARLEAWGPFGRGWAVKSFSAQVSAPQSFPLIAYPKAWSPGINIAAPEPPPPPANGKKGKPAPAMMIKTPEPSHTLTADVVFLEAKDEGELSKYKGQLKGKIVLTSPVTEVKARFAAPGTRLTEKELLALADSPAPGARGGGGRRLDPNDPRFQELRKQQLFNAQKAQFLQDEGAAVLLDAARGDGGTIFVSSASVPQKPDPNNPVSLFLPRVPAYSADAPAIVPQVSLAVEHYNRLVRMVQAGEKVQLTVNLDVQFYSDDLMAYNTVAEIPGSDKADELVMLGAHMDSWHSGTGATDNGAGTAVCMEAVRILQALGLKPRRTIRVALWSGEEQGLLGSRAYVAQHFGKIETPAGADPNAALFGGGPRVIIPTANYDKISAYFNLDNGTGRIRGVYMEGNEGVRPIFRQWLEPFREMGASTLSASPTGGTDHQAFDGIGIPGFQFIQDEIEYDTRTHHSNMDVYDRIQADDMKQAAVIMAAFIYNAAMLDDKLPRKPANVKR